MPMPNYQIQGAPNMMNDPTAMDMAKDFAMGEAMNYGLDMMFPGGGMAKRGVEAVAPAFFNAGGPLYRAPGGYLDDAGFNFGKQGWTRRELYNEANRIADIAEADRTGEERWVSDRYGAEGSVRPGGGDTWHANIKRMIGEEEAKKLKDAEKKKKKAAPAAPPPPNPADMGRTGGAGVDWNVGLGRVGDWDLSTQGSFTRGGEDRFGTKDKDSYNVKLNAARGMDWNKMMGMAPLGERPKSKGRYSDYKGGEYRERLPGERITTDVARGRREDPNAALQPYLDAGISPDQAAMLLANKVPPPRPMERGGPVSNNEMIRRAWQAGDAGMYHDWKAGKNSEQTKRLRQFLKDNPEYRVREKAPPKVTRVGGEASYFNEGGKVPWWKSMMEYAWKNDNMQKRAANQRAKAVKAKQNKDSRGDFDVGALLGSALNMGFFNSGGKVNPASGMYGPIAGMTPGPLGMSDLIAAGKDKDIAKVTYKKSGGDVSQQVDIAYHNPLQPKPAGNSGNSASSNS